MVAHALDRYVEGRSLLHRLDPRVKVLATVFFVLSNALLPDGAWIGFGLSLALVLGVSLASRLGLGYALRRSIVALPFAMAALSVPFIVPGQPIAELALGPWRLVPTDAGVLRFASIVARSLLSVQMAVLLTATTAFPDLLHALRHLRVPSVLVTVVALMHRYLFVLSDEASRLMRARESRSAGRGGASLAWRASVAGHMVGQLFLRSYERSDRVYQAMVARGMSTGHPTMNPHRIDDVDWAALCLFGAGLLATQLVARAL